MALLDVAKSVDRQNPNWLRENTVGKVFKFLEAVKAALVEEGYDVAFVGKTQGEKGFVPNGFKNQNVNGHYIVKLSHDALWVNGKQYDFVAAGNDTNEPIFDNNGNQIVGRPVANPVPPEDWRPNNPPVYNYKVGNVEQAPVSENSKLKDRDTFYKELREINDFYAAFDGLQRSGGMVINGNADVEALGAWGYDLMTGKTVEECKAKIRDSFEWKAKH